MRPAAMPSWWGGAARHPGTVAVARWFEYGHLDGAPRELAKLFAHHCAELLARLPDSPELTVALRKLLEAKDAAVRAAIAAVVDGDLEDLTDQPPAGGA